MLRLLSHLVVLGIGLFRSRGDLLLENLALRQQLAALKPRHSRSRLTKADRIFWVVLRRIWSGWMRALVIVQPETVVRWHRAGFKLYWNWISRKHVRVGRKPTSQELRDLIFRMVAENRTGGAPRIHGELKMLGCDIFVGNCRRDLLDHVIVLNVRHLKRLMTEYSPYYHEDRTHLGLGKQTPVERGAKGTSTQVAVSSQSHAWVAFIIVTMLQPERHFLLRFISVRVR